MFGMFASEEIQVSTMVKPGQWKLIPNTVQRVDLQLCPVHMDRGHNGMIHTLSFTSNEMQYLNYSRTPVEIKRQR